MWSVLLSAGFLVADFGEFDDNEPRDTKLRDRGVMTAHGTVRIEPLPFLETVDQPTTFVVVGLELDVAVAVRRVAPVALDHLMVLFEGQGARLRDVEKTLKSPGRNPLGINLAEKLAELRNAHIGHFRNLHHHGFCLFTAAGLPQQTTQPKQYLSR